MWLNFSYLKFSYPSGIHSTACWLSSTAGPGATSATPAWRSSARMAAGSGSSSRGTRWGHSARRDIFWHWVPRCGSGRTWTWTGPPGSRVPCWSSTTATSRGRRPGWRGSCGGCWSSSRCPSPRRTWSASSGTRRASTAGRRRTGTWGSACTTPPSPPPSTRRRAEWCSTSRRSTTDDSLVMN